MVNVPAFRAILYRAREVLSVRPTVPRFLALGFSAKPTLADLMVSRANNFNLLRFIAASMVLFFHCFALTGHKISELPIRTNVGFMDLGLLGVTVFFAISGFLITQSVTRSGSMFLFLKARLLRILPALVLSTLFCVTIIGPFATTLSQSDYWTDSKTWQYLFHTIALDPQLTLPGVFEHSPYPPAVNGSLWTIPIEVWCYAVLAAVAITGLCRNRWKFNFIAIAVLITFANYEGAIRQLIPSGGAWSTPYLVGAFSSARGAFCIAKLCRYR